MPIIYLELLHIVELHDTAIARSGGISGVQNLGLIESVLAHIQNDDYYPSFEEKITHLFFAINKSHAFNDGNKRASLTSTALFLQINGFSYLVSSFMRRFENYAVYVAENRISKQLLQEMLASLLCEDDFNEALKLKIAHAISLHSRD
jgi:death-on-curing protein